MRETKRRRDGSRTSWMNDTRWQVVFRAVAQSRTPCRIKCWWDEYLDEVAAGAPILRSRDLHGEEPDLYTPDVPFNPSGGYWEGCGQGPFRTSDVDWVAIATEDFDAIRGELPSGLMLATRNRETIILGYDVG